MRELQQAIVEQDPGLALTSAEIAATKATVQGPAVRWSADERSSRR